MVNSEVYKAAEQKRFDLIRKSLEEAKASKAEVRGMGRPATAVMQASTLKGTSSMRLIVSQL